MPTTFDNAASIRMLERVGFVATGEETNFAAARGAALLEYNYRLNATGAPSTSSGTGPVEAVLG